MLFVLLLLFPECIENSQTVISWILLPYEEKGLLSVMCT